MRLGMVGAILAGLAVAAAAFGTHGLRGRLDEAALNTFETAAQLLGVSVRTLRSLAAAQAIEVVQVSARRVGITDCALREFIESRKRPAAARGR